MNGIGSSRGLAAGITILLVTLLGTTTSAQAGVHEVTNLSGGESGGSFLTAIQAANADPDQDVITFANGLSGKIQLATDLPIIGSPMEIRGPGAGQITIDGGGSFSLIRSYRNLKISDLTIANGTTPAGIGGGGIYITDAKLTLNDSVISGNSAAVGGGIAALDAEVMISNSRITNNEAVEDLVNGIGGIGGGIFLMRSNLDTTGSEITDNTALRGGGIYTEPVFEESNAVVRIVKTKITGNQATAEAGTGMGVGGAAIEATKITITDSEFSGNKANAVVGGLTLSGPATVTSTLVANNTSSELAGISFSSNSSAPSRLNNSTVTGNVAKTTLSGVGTLGGNLRVDSSTISGNKVTAPPEPMNGSAGVLQVAGTTELVNSIVAGNSPADFAAVEDPPVGIPDPRPGIIEGSFNLIGTSAAGSVRDTGPGASSNTSITNPKLGPLANNGGPTRTLLPAEDSPAVEMGRTDLPTDQRGLPRGDAKWIPNAKGGNGADIGAVEVQVTPASNNFTFGKVKVNKMKGTATLEIKVPGAGMVQMLGSKSVKAATKSSKKKGAVILTITPKGKAAKTLKMKGKVKIKVQVRFTPTSGRGGPAKTNSKTVKLVRKSKKRRSG